ncbi:15-O-acetyltransferase Tri3-domain-containing protein [Cadophora sp. MPI-SDFR-AT-0126]|nr:15-O-acetyltransferase Tri3-domain-containing protein [Leotiomycetes sp. MPI-SDFR-AT-0126]
MVPGGTILSPLDPSMYSWRQSLLSPSQWHRLALSNECMWFSRPKDPHELFICTLITLNRPISPPTLTSAASLAWQILRFQVPELGVDATCTEDGAVYMQYRMLHSQAEVDAWVDRTSHFENGRDALTFKELKTKGLSKKCGHDSDKTFLLLYSQATRNGEDDRVENVQVMLYADHQVMDGTGLKILLGKYLSLLASALKEPTELQQDEIKWSESYKNLSKPWIQHMNDDQVISGPEYEGTVTRNQDIILNELKLNPGLPLSQNTQNTRPASQETHFITLSPTHTSAILQAIKEVLGPASNITHLCHAALVLALLRNSSPCSSSSQPSSQTLYSPCWLNGRRYLKPTPACPSPTTDYIPICLSFAPIIFNDIGELALSRTASRDEIREKLLKACRMATDQYVGVRERKSMLPGCVNLFEDIGRMMLLNKRTDQAATNHNPPNDNNIATRSSKTAEPFLLSDGLTEQYISHTYPPSSTPSTLPSHPSSQPTLTIQIIHFAAHAEQNLIVRMSSWRGSTTISGEWRGEDYEDGVVVGFLEDVVGIMGMIVEGG